MARRGTLCSCPTPLDLGHRNAWPSPDLQDVLPAGVIRQAAALAHWVAEDARTTRAFLKRVDALVPLAQPLQALHISELPRPAKGVQGSAATGISTPCSRRHWPGRTSAWCPRPACPRWPTRARRWCRRRIAGRAVLPLPGASSLLLALAASGLNGQSFAFVGYLPVEAAARAARIRELEALSRRSRQTQLLIETPYRNAALLAALLTHLQPATRLSVSCGLTLA